MNIREQIKNYITEQPEAKAADMQTLHKRILLAMPKCKLWFLDGKDEKGKVLTNPNIGYGSYNIQYADGATKEFYQIGLSANTTGLSVYILGIKDKKHLPDTYSATLGKASITGYCIKFKKLADINIEVLEAAIKDGVSATSEK